MGKRLSCKNAGPRDRRPGSLYGFSVKLSAHPDIEYKAAPVLGGDNEDIYGHVLGKSKEELEELKKKNAI